MHDRTKRTAGKTEWARVRQWSTDRLTRLRNGRWRLAHEAGGWDGAWEGTSDRVEYVSAEEAARILIQWGVDDDDLARFPSLREFSAELVDR